MSGARKTWCLGPLSMMVLVLMVARANSAQVEGWSLLGREGACLPLSVLGKKGGEFSDIESPYQLADKMRAAGHKTEIKEHKAGSRPAVEVRVPDRNLYVMFVKSDSCTGQRSGTRK